MLTVHHLGVSQSERIVWLCEELGIEYKLVNHQRDPETRLAPEDYRALHPLGTAPIIHDGDIKLAESGAIAEYIMGKYGEGGLAVGPEAPNYADYLFWFHFANGSFMPARMIDMVLHFLGAEDSEVAQMLKSRGMRVFDILEHRLGQVDYLAGDAFTAADIMNFFPLTTMRQFVPMDMSPYPNIRAYMKRIGERPAYRSAMEKGDPGMELLLE
ncbi:MAG: glutathione S-transferase family protein [Alphaproteobacteria bacterium]|nr:glutathione S-transferase family protein [Alphaproteobacteria bacterium]